MTNTPFVLGYLLFIGNLIYREGFLRKGKEARTFKGSKYDKNTTTLAVFLISITFILPLIFNYFRIGAFFTSRVQWIGIGIMVVGLLIHLWSVITLGRFYARTLRIQHKHKIIRAGLYKYIRHPGYLGAIIVGAGFGLATGSVTGFVLIVFMMTVMYAVRIHMEEKMLIDRFGAEYKEYQRKTHKLIPYVL